VDEESFGYSWRRAPPYIVDGVGPWRVMRLAPLRLVYLDSPTHRAELLFQLFGASAVTKEYALGVTDYSKATWTQNFIASIAGAVASITIAAPLDTVKTRIQNANFEQRVPGLTVVRDLIRNEGPTAFFKGLTPKVITVYPSSTSC
jgi:hypothetical protein